MFIVSKSLKLNFWTLTGVMTLSVVSVLNYSFLGLAIRGDSSACSTLINELS